MRPYFKLIGTNIKDCRAYKNITQAVLAEKAGLSIPYISQVETARKHISLHALISIADALEVTVDRLLRGCQDADLFSYITGLEQLLEDCTLYERNIIMDSASALKKNLRNHRTEFEDILSDKWLQCTRQAP